jgi:hypothetical protein
MRGEKSFIYFSLSGSFGEQIAVPLVVDIDIFNKFGVVHFGCNERWGEDQYPKGFKT